jgi:hypothetical protein
MEHNNSNFCNNSIYRAYVLGRLTSTQIKVYFGKSLVVSLPVKIKVNMGQTCEYRIINKEIDRSSIVADYVSFFIIHYFFDSSLYTINDFVNTLQNQSQFEAVECAQGIFLYSGQCSSSKHQHLMLWYLLLVANCEKYPFLLT